jgi:hypothetical protein
MTHWRQKPKSKPAKPLADILRERNEKRTEALIACITMMSVTEDLGTVTHSLVAERVGLPVQYVEWKYPSRENLLAMAAR